MNETPNEQQITDALRGIAAAGGEPDDAAAWRNISAGIAADGKDARRRRVLLGGAGLAIAGAAAALVLVVGAGDDEEAVEVGPAAESTTTTFVDTVPVEPSSTTATPADGADTSLEQEGQPVELPEHPIVVVTQDEGGTSHLHLYDADTGVPVVRDLAETIFGFSHLSIEGNTIYFTEEGGDSEQVLSMPWYGSAEPTPPFGMPVVEEESTRAGTLSPDGSTFAYVEQGILRNEGRIALIDTATKERRYLEWVDGEEDFFLTQGRIDDLAWSPDGTRLAFVSSYEGEELRVVDVDAATLSDSRSIGTGYSPAWTDEESVVVVSSCCYPEFVDQGSLVRITVENPDAGTSTGDDDDLVGVEISGGRVAMVSADGTIETGDQNGTTASLFSFTAEGRAVEVGL
jgi:dipeptidyl aminopeptidase/acylaminoacyl peptidase